MTSPKRKRDQHPVPPLHTDQIEPYPRLHSDLRQQGGHSPRTTVAGRLQSLDIGSEARSGFEGTEPHDRKRVRTEDADDCPTSSPCPPSEQHGGSRGSGQGEVEFTFRHSDTLPVESSVTAALNTRPGSPSLVGEANDLYWIDDEITGHNPDDPTDDGYGINGIGFRPTAGQAYQRSQRRQQQLAEYRSRETREARQRRGERRRTALTESAEPSIGEEKKARVHFEEG